MTVIGSQAGLTLDRIVLATDFSPRSEKAAGYAQGLAKRFSSSLSLANIVDLSVATGVEGAISGRPVDEIQHSSAVNQTKLLENLMCAGVRAHAHKTESTHPATLAAVAKELRADLVVAGTNARLGLKETRCSCTCPEGIIRYAGCRVLTIGPKAKPAPKGAFSFHTVVFATDFSSHEKIQAAVALGFAQDSIEQVYFCHVLQRQGKDIADTQQKGLRAQTALEKLMPQTTFDRCSSERVVEHETAASHILELASKINADLIVLGTEHSASWCIHRLKETIEQVLMNAECPVMTVAATEHEATAKRDALYSISPREVPGKEPATPRAA